MTAFTSDSRRKQRSAGAVLTEREVKLIKQNLLQGKSRREIARAYGVATETIARIDRGDTWDWVKAFSEEIPEHAKSREELGQEKQKLFLQLIADGVVPRPEPGTALFAELGLEIPPEQPNPAPLEIRPSSLASSSSEEDYPLIADTELEVFKECPASFVQPPALSKLLSLTQQAAPTVASRLLKEIKK